MPLTESLDPYTSTRRAFTDNLVNAQIPEDAAKDWAHLARTHQDLLKGLFDHPAMEPNREQTYMTPANVKTKVYFMWDFVGRTLGMLYQIPPTLPRKIARSSMWQQDVRGRALFAETLITKPDDPKARMVFVNNDQEVDFGEEVIRLAKKISEPEG